MGFPNRGERGGAPHLGKIPTFSRFFFGQLSAAYFLTLKRYKFTFRLENWISIADAIFQSCLIINIYSQGCQIWSAVSASSILIEYIQIHVWLTILNTSLSQQTDSFKGIFVKLSSSFWRFWNSIFLHICSHINQLNFLFSWGSSHFRQLELVRTKHC